ncbi:MAG TPA: coenzyme F420-0:L-glutamate ligase [Nocardioidaceae bacterium]|nr:coenzyme F420-0:L-glutamate ligase [Nocardioidaceae bacterium]
MSRSAAALTVRALDGVGEIEPGTDLAAVLAPLADLSDGDVLVVTSKAVSKAEGRVMHTDKQAASAAETERPVAVRGSTAIVRTRHGLVMAGAGVDDSNTPPGSVVLLPLDPDASARTLRERLLADASVNVAVVVTDTAGRAWRLGQIDLAIGVAGLEVLHDYAGTVDGYGNTLQVTAPAVADEIAAAADLVKAKLAGLPAAVVTGLADLVLPAGSHGPGAGALIRDESSDLFGYGARDAVLLALRGEPADLRGFGAPCDAGTLVVHLERLEPPVSVRPCEGRVSVGGMDQAVRARLVAAAFACGWTVDPGGAADELLLRPGG